jgi:AraC-like DNA-binding protein
LSGFNPNEFLRKYRLHKAAELILKKELTISEIAFQVGFEHVSYFSRAFQEEYQILPSEYS